MHGSGGCGEGDGFGVGEESGSGRDFSRRAGESEVSDDRGEIGSAGAGHGEVLPDCGCGFVATVRDVRHGGAVGDGVDGVDAGVGGGIEGEIEAEVAAVGVVLVDFGGDDVVAGDKGGGGDVVGGVVVFAGGGIAGVGG